MIKIMLPDSAKADIEKIKEYFDENTAAKAVLRCVNSFEMMTYVEMKLKDAQREIKLLKSRLNEKGD
jgi:hypothetical protein